MMGCVAGLLLTPPPSHTHTSHVSQNLLVETRIVLMLVLRRRGELTGLFWISIFQIPGQEIMVRISTMMLLLF
jgi:hypothetical protein